MYMCRTVGTFCGCDLGTFVYSLAGKERQYILTEIKKSVKTLYFLSLDAYSERVTSQNYGFIKLRKQTKSI